MKTKFELEKNGSYPNQKAMINIIGKNPDNAPYVSVTFQDNGTDIGHAWIKDKDLKRFAENILKAIG